MGQPSLDVPHVPYKGVIKSCDTIKIDIRKKINQLELKYPKSCLLLTDRYILHKSFKEIFEHSKYTEIKSVYNNHDQAIKDFIEIHGNNF